MSQANQPQPKGGAQKSPDQKQHLTFIPILPLGKKQPSTPRPFCSPGQSQATGPSSPGPLSCSVVSDSLRPHGPQHARLPCPSPPPRVCSNSCPTELVTPSNHLILCRPLLLLPSTFPSSLLTLYSGSTPSAEPLHPPLFIHSHSVDAGSFLPSASWLKGNRGSLEGLQVSGPPI